MSIVQVIGNLKCEKPVEVLFEGAKIVGGDRMLR